MSRHGDIPAWHELSDGAHDALERAMDAAGTKYGANTADYYIAAVWPHLYAAALRHAAEQVGDWSMTGRYGLSTSAGPGVVLATARRELRRLADEAEPGVEKWIRENPDAVKP
jgi:hypothetical protein